MSELSNNQRNLTAALSRITALHGDADGIADVVAVGTQAVPALRHILFQREPSGLHQVRCRAVEALGLLGAFDVLEEYLRAPRRGDPVERLGDDVVVSAAARAIARRNDNETFELLCELARTHPLNGLIAALATFQQPSTVPIFIEALGEDEVRQTAEAAVASFGPDAWPLLLDAIDSFKLTNTLPESQLRKCRSLLLLLGEASLSSKEIDRLRPFMANPDLQVSLRAYRIALRSESKRTRSEARAQLGRLRERAPWLEQLQIDQYLASAP